MRPAVDPWADGDPLGGDTLEFGPVPPLADPSVGRPARRIYGRVYELFTTRPDLDGEHPYVGKTEQTIHQRVRVGKWAHTSPASIAKDPWKARIKPGKAGYRLLETIYDTGDPDENDRALRRAEAFWIDRLKTTKNKVRPVRPAGPAPAPRRRDPLKPMTQRQQATRRRERLAKVRFLAFLSLFIPIAYLVGRVVTEMSLPWPAPVQFGVTLAVTMGLSLAAFFQLDRTFRRVTRGRR